MRNGLEAPRAHPERNLLNLQKSPRRQRLEAEQVELVQDNLNTHQGGSFYAHLPPDEALTVAERFAMHFTPKGASWLNMRAGPEGAVLPKTD